MTANASEEDRRRRMLRPGRRLSAMPKRKWNRLHDDSTIDEERHRRSLALKDQQEARATVDEAILEVAEKPPAEADERREDAVQAADVRRGPPKNPLPGRRRRPPRQ